MKILELSVVRLVAINIEDFPCTQKMDQFIGFTCNPVLARCQHRNNLTLNALGIFSSPEPKAHGELIVYRSIRRPSVSPCVRGSVRKHFQTRISPQLGVGD